jgi:predicted small metal-binding protein
MLELRCADLGIACRKTVMAGTEEELVQKVAEHAERRHGVPELNQTLIAYAVKRARATDGVAP